MPQSLLFTSLASAITLIVGGPLNAAIIATASFEDNSAGALASQSGGTGWTNAWSSSVAATVVNASLSYSSGSVSSNGGSQAVSVLNTASINDSALERKFTSQTGDVYMSFLWRESVNDDSPGTGDDFAQIGFDPAADNGNPNLSFQRQDGTLNLRTGTAGYTSSGTTGVVGATYMIVLKATTTGSNYNTDLWVNPSSLTEGASDVSGTGAGISEIGTFLGRVAFGEVGDTFQVDNIRIGTTWSDVVVPEPSIAALIGIAAGLGLLRRRRRQGAE